MQQSDESDPPWDSYDSYKSSQQGWRFNWITREFMRTPDAQGIHRFQSTEDALAFVMKQAEAGDELALKAIRKIALDAAGRHR